ncbi:putative reverse transcriptase domain-containing protein [Tanacetum coccineum]
MPLLAYLNLGLGELAHTRLTVELADRTVKYPKGIAKNVLDGIGKFTFLIDFIILDMLEDVKVPLILGRPFLSTARAKIDVYKRKITLRVREEKIIFKSVKPASSIIKRVYMLSLRERMELDLEARLMGETLVLNRSEDPFSGDYIELNDLNEPFRRNQGDDLMPTIKEVKSGDDEASNHEDALDTGAAPKQQQQVIQMETPRIEFHWKGWCYSRILSTVTAAEIQAVEKERKAENILLMTIPKEHMRRFHGMDDAK